MSGEQITTSRRMIHNTLFNVVMRLSGAVVTFLLIRFFLVRLGEEKYGVWLLVASIFNYRGILSMGLNSSVNRYIPMYLAKEDKDGIQKVINTGLFTFSILSVVLLAATLIVYMNLDSWFVIDPGLTDVAKLLVLIVGCCFCMAMPLQLSSAVLSGLQRYDIINLIEFAMLVARTGLLVVFLLMDYGLIAMGFIFGLNELFVRIIQLFFIKRLLPDVRIAKRFVDIKFLGPMIGYGINTLLYSMGAIIIYKASDVIIGIFMSPAYITRFYVATAALLMVSQLMQTFVAAIKPAVSDLDARNDHEKVRQIAFFSQKYTLLLLIPAMAFFVIMGREFLTVWLGSKYTPEVIGELSVILTILAIGHGLRLSQHSNFVVLVGKGEHRVFGILTAFMALVCVILSILSLKFFDLGLIGVAWANCVPMTVICGLILPIYFCWKMKISVKECFYRSWGPALLGSVPGVVLILVWKYLYSPQNWAGMIMVVLSTGLVTVVSSWFLSFNELERQRFTRVLLRNKS